MIGPLLAQRPRPRTHRPGAFFVPVALLAGAAFLLPAPAAAQGPDTAAAAVDTVGGAPPADVRSGQDTIPQDTAVVDSQLPPPTLPQLHRPGPVGWAAGVWEWDRAALLRLPDVTLLQLLTRVPGLTPVRAGMVGQPESAAVLGATAGAIRYVLDGFALDPLVAPTFDASRISLLALEGVRVERRVTGATVYLETVSPTAPNPVSVIEAATGDIGTNLFRGTFLAPRVLGGSLGVGFERLATGVQGGANHLTGWAQWTFVRDSSGVQLELRQSDMDRSGVGGGLVGARRDWGVRARTRLGPVAAEAYAGATTVEDEVGSVVLREGTPQGGVRLHSALPSPVPLEATAALRLRSHPRLPRQEIELSAWATPAPWLGVGGEVVQGWWDGPVVTGRWSARAVLRPVVGITAFAGIHAGGALLGEGGPEVLVPAVRATGPVSVDRDGVRAGLEARWRGFQAGAAAIRTRAGSVPGFGLPFDSTAPSFGGGEAEGIEATLRIPTPLHPIWLEGWYVGMDRPETWLYLPRHQWKAALLYHHFPIPSGNLELYSRIEHVFRGSMVAPVYEADGWSVARPATVPAYRATNAELVIRVLSVRAFVRWDNVLHRLQQSDLPGTAYWLPGQNLTYGVKWTFTN